MSEEAQLIGHWDEVISRLDLLDKRVKKAVQKSLRKSAFHLHATIVNHLHNQDLPWEDLDPAYLEWKREEGFSTSTWIRSSELMQSIDVRRANRGTTYFVGVHRNVRTIDGELFPIAAKLEFGSKDGGRTQKARPLFQPSFDENKENIKKDLRKEFEKAIELSTQARIAAGGLGV